LEANDVFDIFFNFVVCLSLFNITLTPTLRAEIIATQKDDEGMDHIKRRMREGDPKVACFREDEEGTLWFKERLVVPRREALKKKFWLKPIRHDTPFILGALRCIMT
jgi:hypothetical protein